MHGATAYYASGHAPVAFQLPSVQDVSYKIQCLSLHLRSRRGSAEGVRSYMRSYISSGTLSSSSLPHRLQEVEQAVCLSLRCAQVQV